DAENDLLLDARVLIAAVELRRNRPIFRPILRNVRIEQVEWNAPDLDAPDAKQHLAAGQRCGDQRRIARGISLGNERQRKEVVFGEALLLPPLRVQILAEVPFAIHQADADEWDAQITGAFKMIAREDAETAGVNGDALMNAELSREVSDASIGVGGKVAPEPG